MAGLLMTLFFVSGSCLAGLTDKEKGVRNGNRHSAERYLDIVFAFENERFLINQIKYIHKAYVQQGKTIDSFRLSRDLRKTALTNLIISGFDIYWEESKYLMRRGTHLLEVHLYERVVEETQQNIRAYNQNGFLVLDEFHASDRTESLRELIELAVQHSFSKYPNRPYSHKALANQLAYILIELHEIYWKPRALRNLNARYHAVKAESEGKPSFTHYRQYLIDTLTSDPNKTLWYTFKPDKTNTGKPTRNYKSIQTVLAGHFPDVEAFSPESVNRYPRSTYSKPKATVKPPVAEDASYSSLYFAVKVVVGWMVGVNIVGAACYFCSDRPSRDKKAFERGEKDAARFEQNEDRELFNQRNLRKRRFSDSKPSMLLGQGGGGGSVFTSSAVPMHRAEPETELTRRLSTTSSGSDGTSQEQWQFLTDLTMAVLTAAENEANERHQQESDEGRATSVQDASEVRTAWGYGSTTRRGSSSDEEPPSSNWGFSWDNQDSSSWGFSSLDNHYNDSSPDWPGGGKSLDEVQNMVYSDNEDDW